MSQPYWAGRSRQGEGMHAVEQDAGDSSLSPLPAFQPRARHTDEQLRTLAYEVTVAEARERERIALGLHDDIGQVLAIIGLKLGELAAARDAMASQALLAQARELLAQAIRATRCATFELSSPVLQQLGLQAAIESLVPRLEAAGIKVTVAGGLPPLEVQPQVLAIVFRVLRELLANLVKHAKARRALITLHADEQLLLVAVADDGVGFDADRPRVGFGPDGGYGLFSAEAQMQAIGGRLHVESSPSRGTRATVSLPLQPAASVDGH